MVRSYISFSRDIWFISKLLNRNPECGKVSSFIRPCGGGAYWSHRLRVSNMNSMLQAIFGLNGENLRLKSLYRIIWNDTPRVNPEANNTRENKTVSGKKRPHSHSQAGIHNPAPAHHRMLVRRNGSRARKHRLYPICCSTCRETLRPIKATAGPRSIKKGLT